jgi:hypothetical protein
MRDDLDGLNAVAALALLHKEAAPNTASLASMIRSWFKGAGKVDKPATQAAEAIQPPPSLLRRTGSVLATPVTYPYSKYKQTSKYLEGLPGFSTMARITGSKPVRYTASGLLAESAGEAVYDSALLNEGRANDVDSFGNSVAIKANDAGDRSRARGEWLADKYKNADWFGAKLPWMAARMGTAAGRSQLAEQGAIPALSGYAGAAVDEATGTSAGSYGSLVPYLLESRFNPAAAVTMMPDMLHPLARNISAAVAAVPEALAGTGNTYKEWE